jgi:hypothetical protein
MANTKITSKVIADANILTAAIADNAVTGDKVADDVALAGNPTTTTQTAGNSTTRLATTAFVSTAISNLVDSSPAALNTLNELAAALGDDANFSTTVTNSIATKLPLAGGTMTGNIAHAGAFKLDVGGVLTLDADGSHIVFADDGTEFGRVSNESSNFVLYSLVADKDIKFNGVPSGGSSFTALTLDMSNAGAATFNAGANFSGNVDISVGSNLNSEIKQLSFDNFPNEGIGITFSRTSSDADLMAIGVADTSLLNIASRSGLIFSTGGGTTYSATSESMRIDSSGNVGIGESTPLGNLHVKSGESSGSADANADELVIEGAGNHGIQFLGSNSSQIQLLFGDNNDSDVGYLNYNHSNNSLSLGVNAAERMRIDSSGNVLVGKTSLDNGTIGTEIKFNGGLINVTNSAAQCMTINRLTSDGMLVLFQQDTNSEGSIQVSGSTVSYNGFSGNHESSGIASDTAKGTVCSTIDELDTYVSGTKEGQTRTDHAKIKVSDTVGDARVYGVLSSYSETDNKPIVASVGIGSVLVTGACEGGDLLESNGDGTAKVQDDDIIRSKTIGKVTIGNSDTNVKLVSCVLYCG